MLKKYFKFEGMGTNLKTEIIGGVTTFMTMAYIIFVNPQILSAGAGMDFNAVLIATCIASAVATLLMGFLANYPIALAPGMGLNAFFSFTICKSMGVPWQVALGMVFISGTIFTILTLLKIREEIVNSIPNNLKLAAAVGIGLFIAFIGFKDAGIVVSSPATYVKLGNIRSIPTLLSIIGLLITIILLVRKVKGAILIGIISTAIIGIIIGKIKYEGVIGLPEVTEPAFFKLNIAGVFKLKYLMPIFVLLFFDMFDTIGTLVGVSEQAGFLKEGKLPRAGRALLSDSIGTIIGSLLGTSTVTSYIESSAGVAEGSRTGFSNIITALLFIIAIFFAPIANMIGGGCEYQGLQLFPVTAPALIVVGFLMMSNVAKIDWNDLTETIPAFLTIIIMPLTFSISEGLAVGFITYTILKIATGKAKELNPIVIILSVIFILRYIFLKF
jgi:AGZA family xanthine/uracil permease-like MFS transporter